LDQSFAAELKFISVRGCVCHSGERNTEMGNEFGIYSVNEELQETKGVLV
jgi:hypothetical protein